MLRLAPHVRESTCIRFITCIMENEHIIARAWIGDYNSQQVPNLTVFNVTNQLDWKPVMLRGPGVAQYCMYLTVQRNGNGLWFIMIRSYSPESILQQIKVKIELYKKGDNVESSGTARIHQRYIYEGLVVPNSMSNEEASQAGRLLLLNDGQVKLLKTSDTIFEYKIAVIVTVAP